MRWWRAFPLLFPPSPSHYYQVLFYNITYRLPILQLLLVVVHPIQAFLVIIALTLLFQ